MLQRDTAGIAREYWGRRTIDVIKLGVSMQGGTFFQIEK